MVLGTKKIPEPMTDPIRIVVASTGPRTRRSSGAECVALIYSIPNPLHKFSITPGINLFLKRDNITEESDNVKREF
jgi:hypothetical protein